MFGWLRDLDTNERRALIACFGGWALDAMDVQIYSLVIPALLTVWGISTAQAGVLGTVTLLVSAFGGLLAGMLADRIGRVRVLQITILWYSVFTCLSGFTANYTQLFICRALQGLGFGGEWAAGAVLMAETIRDKYRGRAVGTVQSGYAPGWAVAAIAYTVIFALLPSTLGWRLMFWIGILPALLVIYIRAFVPEPEVFHRAQVRTARAGSWANFTGPVITRTVICAVMTTGAQGGAYALITWLPTYLKVQRHLSVLGTGGYLTVVIVGSFCGFLTAAYLADLFGRRNTVCLFAVCATIMVFVYMLLPITDTAMLFLGFPLGFFWNGMFSPMGPFLSELFPTAIRGTAQGFAYNAGRGIGALFPTFVGIMSGTMPLGRAIGTFTLIAYGVMLVAALSLPETKGRALPA